MKTRVLAVELESPENASWSKKSSSLSRKLTLQLVTTPAHKLFDLHNFAHLGALIHFPGFLTMAMEKVSYKSQLHYLHQGLGKLPCKSLQNFAAACSGALLKHRSQDMQFSHSLLMPPSRKSGVLTFRHL